MFNLFSLKNVYKYVRLKRKIKAKKEKVVVKEIDTNTLSEALKDKLKVK